MRIPLILVALLATAGSAAAFDGSIKLRTMAVSTDQLAAANGGKVPDAAATLKLMPEALLKDAKPDVKESTVYVSGKKVRMDAPLEGNRAGYAIIDLDKGLTWFVVPAEKRYIEWSEADATAMADKMKQLRKMMDERMAKMPPDQRTQMEAMMKNMGPPDGEAKAAPITTKSLDRSQTINGMKATAYEAVDGDATVIGWVTQDRPGLDKTLREVSERMEQMTPASMRKETVRKVLQDKGLPVLVQTLQGGRYRIEEVLAVEEKPVPAELFVVPADFARTTGRDALKGMPQ